MTALEFWRRESDLLGSPTTFHRAEPQRKKNVPIDTPSAAIVKDLVDWQLARPGNIQLLVPSSEKRRTLKGSQCLICTGPYPTGSFARARGSIFATCPELTFLMLARELDLVPLLEIGYELCGTYRMLDGMPAYGYQPLTTCAKIRAYVNRAKGMHGRTDALRACQWLLDNSASPAETALAMMFKLPYRHGGYALGDFLLNHEIVLNETAARILGRETIRPDLYWLRARHPSEYDSSTHHSSREQAEYDERRRNAYAAMDMNVTVFRPRHLVDITLLDEMVRAIRRNTGIRQRKVPKDYEFLKRALYQEVFRYWLDLNFEHGNGSEFLLRAAAMAEPDSPW